VEPLSRMVGNAGRIALVAVTTTMVASPAWAASRVIAVPCDTASLIAAIDSANTVPVSLRLAPHCVYTLTDQLPDISGDVALLGGPATAIRAGVPGFRILNVLTPGILHARGIALQNATITGPAVGAGIHNEGTLFLDFVTVEGNTATLTLGGGGLANENTGRAFIADSVFRGNTETANGFGGGGAIFNLARLTLVRSRLTGNSGSLGGGLFALNGASTRIIESTIDHNTAARTGGGIHNFGATSVNRTLITANSAPAGGGGLFNQVGSPAALFVRASVISGNTPDNEKYA
jgi:hypothetical protein